MVEKPQAAELRGWLTKRGTGELQARRSPGLDEKAAGIVDVGPNLWYAIHAHVLALVTGGPLGGLLDVPLDDQGACRLSNRMDGEVSEASVGSVYCCQVVGKKAVSTTTGTLSVGVEIGR